MREVEVALPAMGTFDGGKAAVQGTEFGAMARNFGWQPGQHDKGPTSVLSHSWIILDYLVSWNRGTPKSSILIGFSLINHPFGSNPMAMESPICDHTIFKTWSVPLDNIARWWFGTFFILQILGNSSSQLTNSVIFQSGGSTTNQIVSYSLILSNNMFFGPPTSLYSARLKPRLM